MPRPRNPEADPVKIVRNGRAVQYWPSGWVGEGDARREKACKPEEAEALADALRAELYAKRQTETGAVFAAPHPNATIEDSYEAWIVSLEGASRGTRTKYVSVAHKWMALIGGNLCTEMDETLWETVLAAGVASGMADNTLDGLNIAMRAWRKWARKTGWLPPRCLADPEALTDIHKAQKRRLQRQRADAAATEITVADISADGDDDEGIDLADVPTPANVDALAAAIYRRETERAPWAPSTGAGSKGGAERLDQETGWRLSESVRAQAAMGLRMCELLGLHSSAISKDGRIHVKRQLDRYRPWTPGENPPVTAPKGGKARYTQCWTWYLPELEKLAAYADEHLDGWLFAPTRGQRHWARAWSNAVSRGIELLNWEADQAPAGQPVDRWTWNPHYLRHHYGSWSIAPKEVGGYGWPLAQVSELLGHSSTAVTANVYHHRVGDDTALARESSRGRPGEQ